MSVKFSKSEAIKFGWNTTLHNLVFLIVLLLIVMGIHLGFSFIEGAVGDGPTKFVFSLISYFVKIVVSIGMIKVALKFVDGKKAKYDDLFVEYKNYGKIFNYLIGSMVYGLIVFVGLILLVIPGIYFGIRLSFMYYYIVDKNYKFTDAMRASWGITKGQVFNLFLLGFLFVLITLLGLSAFVVGLLVAVPTTFLAHAYVYRKLSK